MVWDLCEGLGELGHSVVLFAPKGSQKPSKGELVETPPAEGKVQVDWMEAERRMFEVYKPFLKDFDGVISDHGWQGFIYLLKQENPSLKVLHTCHGPNIWGTYPPVKYANLISISNDQGLRFSLQYGRVVRTAYNGVNTEMYKFQKDKSERFLWLARVDRIKGPDMALRVAKKMRIPLDIVGATSFVGDQSYVLNIMDQCDKHLWKFIGEVSHQEKVKYYQNAKAFFMLPQAPAFVEPFGLTAIESGLCGTPVIALRNGAIPELVKDGVNGFICDSEEDLCRAVDRVDEIKPENCRAEAMRFSRENMSKRYESLFKDVEQNIQW